METPTAEDEQARADICAELAERLRTLGASMGGALSAEAHGSFVMGCYSSASALEVAVIGKLPGATHAKGPAVDVELRAPTERLALLERVHGLIRDSGMAAQGTVAIHRAARVPSVSFEHAGSGIPVRLCIAYPGFALRGQVVRGLAGLEPRLRSLLQLVELWAEARGLNNPAAGTFNSWALMNLAIFAAQTFQSQPLLPPLWRVCGPGETVPGAGAGGQAGAAASGSGGAASGASVTGGSGGGAASAVLRPAQRVPLASSSEALLPVLREIDARLSGPPEALGLPAAGSLSSGRVGLLPLFHWFLLLLDRLLAAWQLSWNRRWRVSTWAGTLVQQPFNRAFLVPVECPFDSADNAAKSLGCENQPRHQEAFRTVVAEVNASLRLLLATKAPQDLDRVVLGLFGLEVEHLYLEEDEEEEEQGLDDGMEQGCPLGQQAEGAQPQPSQAEQVDCAQASSPAHEQERGSQVQVAGGPAPAERSQESVPDCIPSRRASQQHGGAHATEGSDASGPAVAEGVDGTGLPAAATGGAGPALEPTAQGPDQPGCSRELAFEDEAVLVVVGVGMEAARNGGGARSGSPARTDERPSSVVATTGPAAGNAMATAGAPAAAAPGGAAPPSQAAGPAALRANAMVQRPLAPLLRDVTNGRQRGESPGSEPKPGGPPGTPALPTSTAAAAASPARAPASAATPEPFMGIEGFFGSFLEGARRLFDNVAQGVAELGEDLNELAATTAATIRAVINDDEDLPFFSSALRERQRRNQRLQLLHRVPGSGAAGAGQSPASAAGQARTPGTPGSAAARSVASAASPGMSPRPPRQPRVRASPSGAAAVKGGAATGRLSQAAVAAPAGSGGNGAGARGSGKPPSAAPSPAKPKAAATAPGAAAGAPQRPDGCLSSPPPKPHRQQRLQQDSGVPVAGTDAVAAPELAASSHNAMEAHLSAAVGSGGTCAGSPGVPAKPALDADSLRSESACAAGPGEVPSVGCNAQVPCSSGDARPQFDPLGDLPVVSVRCLNADVDDRTSHGAPVASCVPGGDEKAAALPGAAGAAPPLPAASTQFLPDISAAAGSDQDQPGSRGTEASSAIAVDAEPGARAHAEPAAAPDAASTAASATEHSCAASSSDATGRVSVSGSITNSTAPSTSPASSPTAGSSGPLSRTPTRRHRGGAVISGGSGGPPCQTAAGTTSAGAASAPRAPPPLPPPPPPPVGMGGLRVKSAAFRKGAAREPLMPFASHSAAPGPASAAPSSAPAAPPTTFPRLRPASSFPFPAASSGSTQTSNASSSSSSAAAAAAPAPSPLPPRTTIALSSGRLQELAECIDRAGPATTLDLQGHTFAGPLAAPVMKVTAPGVWLVNGCLALLPDQQLLVVAKGVELRDVSLRDTATGSTLSAAAALPPVSGGGAAPASGGAASSAAAASGGRPAVLVTKQSYAGGGELTLSRCSLHLGTDRSVGLQVKGKGCSLTATGCTVVGSSLAAVQAADAAVSLTGCTLRGGGGHGLLCRDNATACAADCTLAGFGGAAAAALAGGSLELTGCTLRGSAADGDGGDGGSGGGGSEVLRSRASSECGGGAALSGAAASALAAGAGVLAEGKGSAVVARGSVLSGFGSQAALVVTAGAAASLEDCKATGCLMGALVGTRGGRLLASRCELSCHAAEGLSVGEGATADLRDCRLQANGGPGLRVAGVGSMAVMRACDAARNRCAGVAVGAGGCANLDGCSACENLVGESRGCGSGASGAADDGAGEQPTVSDGCGLRVDGAGARATAARCVFARNAGPGVAAGGHGSAQLTGCRMEGNGRGGAGEALAAAADSMQEGGDQAGSGAASEMDGHAAGEGQGTQLEVGPHGRVVLSGGCSWGNGLLAAEEGTGGSVGGRGVRIAALGSLEVLK